MDNETDSKATHYMATVSINMGWQCPVCDKCYAPWVPKCEDCGSGSDFTVKYNDNMAGCEHIWSPNSQTIMGVFCIYCGHPQTPPAASGNVCSNEGEVNG
jgi:uncharacterized OB-fold protein